MQHIIQCDIMEQNKTNSDNEFNENLTNKVEW